MNLYKIQFKALTPYVGTLASNTFFGAFCNAYKDIYSENKLVELLEQLKDNKAELTFSDSFKSGYIPLRTDRGNNKLIRIDTIGTEKEDIILSITDNEVRLNSKIGDNNNEVFEVTRRNLNGTADVYLVSSLEYDKLRKTIELAFSKGLGGRKSIGNGILELMSMDEYAFDICSKNGFLVLGNIVPDSSLTLDTEFIPVIRKGITVGGKVQKPVLMFKTGSVFKNICKTLTCGTVIYDENSNSYINGKAICFPIEV